MKKTEAPTRERSRRAIAEPAAHSRRERARQSAPEPAQADPRSARASRRASQEQGEGLYTGDNLLAAFSREEQKAHEREELRKSGILYLNRFWMNQGEEKEIIILDHEIKAGIGIYEHTFKGLDGKWGHYDMCIKEKGECPLCALHGDSYFILYLSVLDLTGFTTKKGRKVEQSKALLGLKRTQIQSFLDIENAAMEAHGTLRGTYMVMSRPMGNATSSPRIGEPRLLKGGKMFDHYSEKELVAEFGHPAVKGEQDGKIIRPANFDITPFPYRDIFKFPDVLEFQRKHGASPSAGSQAEQDDEWSAAGDSGDAHEEDARPARGSRRERPVQDDEDEADPLAKRPAARSRR